VIEDKVIAFLKLDETGPTLTSIRRAENSPSTCAQEDTAGVAWVIRKTSGITAVRTQRYPLSSPRVPAQHDNESDAQRHADNRRVCTPQETT
jgi:hypothetical protein